MTTTICKMNNHAEERNQLCICLARIAKERYIKNKEKRERGDKTQEKLDIFTMPNHIKKMFGDFLKTPKYTELAILKEHTNSVYSLAAFGNKLYSGSQDKTIRIWNTETYEEIATFRGHTDSVLCLTLHENKLYSGSWDTINIWNTETHEHIGTLKGHSGSVSCLTHYENKFVSGGRDKTIRIWNTETYEQIATLHTEDVLCLALHKNKL